MKSILFNLSLLLLCIPVSAANYYLASNGNDSNDGLSPAKAWRSIDKLNSFHTKLLPGDSILFRRGDSFSGEISFNISGANGNPIVFSAFGQGKNPIITGGVKLTNWQKLPGTKLWYASASDSIAFLWMNDEFQTLARHPNNGYLTMDGGSLTNMTSEDIKGHGANYWKGATVRMRTKRWTYEYRPIASSTNAGELKWNEPNRYRADEGWGFFIDNKYELLDTPGEWYYDSNQGRVYLWPLNNVDPNNQDLEGAVYEYGFWNHRGKKLENYQFFNLTFSHQIKEGLRYSNLTNKNLTIENCKFLQQGQTGMHVTGSNVVVRNNYFAEQLGRAVKGHYVSGGIIRDNIVKRVGLKDGYGISGNQNMNGFHFTRSDNVYMGYNRIDSVGYTGISCYMAYSTVERNIVNYSNLRLDDGSGIYCYDTQSNNMLIQDNIVRYVVGYSVGTAKEEKPTSHGIYLDNFVYNITVRNNTVIGVGTSGIFVNSGATGCVVEDNLTLDYGEQGIRVMEWKKANHTFNNTFKRNVCYSQHPDQEPVFLVSLYGTVPNLATFEDNYLINPYSDYTMRQGNYVNQFNHTQEEWDQKWPHMTTNNKETPFRWLNYEVLEDLSINLVENGEFSTDYNSWSFTNNSNVISGWLSNGGLDGGCMEMNIKNSNIGTIQTGLGANLKKDAFYRIQYSTISPQFGIMEVVFLDAGGQLVHKLQMPYTPTRRDHDFVIQFPADLPNGSIGFRQKQAWGQHFIIDNIDIREVNAKTEDTQSRFEVFTNETSSSKTETLAGLYYDLDGAPVAGSITLNPYSSRLLFRGEANPSNLPPKAICTADSTAGYAALVVQFDATASVDPDGTIVSYDWDFGDGNSASGQTPTHTYVQPGNYQAQLIVTDDQGAQDTAVESIVVMQTVTNVGPCNLPPNWISLEIGVHSVNAAACMDANSGEFQISSAGEKIDRKWDNFHYLYQKMVGDGWMIGRIKEVQNVSADAATGLMIRNSKWGDDQNIFIGISGKEEWISSHRDRQNVSTVRTKGGTGTASMDSYLKVERIGNTFNSYLSANGSSWTLIDTRTISMQTEVMIGMASISGDPLTSANMRVDQLSMSSSVGTSTFPVELTAFDGEIVNETAYLDWVTETELNNDYFTVERSVDGVSFEIVGHVDGKGTSLEQNRYRLEDREPYKGTTFYRLKQTDLDGSFQYLSTIELTYSRRNKAKMNAYPNPVSDRQLSITLEGIDAQSIEQMYLMDLSGRAVAPIPVTDKYLNWVIPSVVSPGTYVLVAIHSEGMIRKQITVL